MCRFSSVDFRKTTVPNAVHLPGALSPYAVNLPEEEAEKAKAFLTQRSKDRKEMRRGRFDV